MQSRLAAMLAVTISLIQFGWSQGSMATISGTVRDGSGAVVPRVAIMVRNLDTNITRSVNTDDQGRYTAPTLSLGNYQVRAELAGFEAAVRSGISLTVGQEAVIDFVLKVGEITQSVEVMGAAPLVETTSGAISGLVGEQQMRDMPLNGRSYDQLVALQAGTTIFTSYAANGVNGGDGAKFSVSGARWRSNKFYQDGTELSGGSYLGDSPGSAAGLNLGVEAIREFRVLTNSYSPEYGKRSGGAIITVTRSGTNTLHGSAFEYLRNSALDARNFFDIKANPADRRLPAFRRNNFGGSLGGRIIKDKSFFFGTYEGVREGLGLSQVAVVPDANAHRGLVPGPGGALSNVGVAPAAAPFLSLFPLPNGPTFPDGTGFYFNSPTRTSSENYGLVRWDHNFSESDSGFVTYNIDRAQRLQPLLIPVFTDSVPTSSHVMTLSESHIFSSSLINTLRFGFNRATNKVDAIPEVPIGPQQEFIPGSGFGAFAFLNGISPLGDNLAGTALFNNMFQTSDDLFFTRGKHSWAFGFQVQRMQKNENAQVFQAGTFEFSTLQGLVQGVANRYRGAAAPGLQGRLNIGVDTQINPWKGWRHTYYGFYAKDKVALTPRLTADLGFRYESLMSPGEVNGRLANMVFQNISSAGRVVRTVPAVGEQLFASSHSYAPRIGLAWDPAGNGKTSIRAGWGMFYEQLDNDYRFFADLTPPFILRVDWRGAAIPGFPHPFENPNVNVSNVTVTTRMIDTNIVPSTVFQYNLTVEREAVHGTLVRAAYIGSHGYHLTNSTEVNLRPAQILADGRKFFDSRLLLLNPILGPTTLMMGNAQSFYNSAVLEVERRPMERGALKGLGFRAAYTFSKSIDDGSQLSNSDSGNSTGQPQDSMDIKANRGLSSFDQRHRLVFNFTWDLPNVTNAKVSGKFLNGWQLNGITSASKGAPLSMEVGFNVSNTGAQTFGDKPNLAPGGNLNPVLGGPDLYFDPNQFVLPSPGTFGNVGRDTVIGPGTVNQDFSLTKNLPFSSVSESFRMQFKAEVFNLFNHANFGSPGRALFTSNGGRVGTAGVIRSANTSRQIQFGLKILF